LSILITGISGQDGRILAHNLISRGQEIVGLCRDSQFKQVNAIFPTSKIQTLDIKNENEIINLLNREKPKIIYNYLGFSSVKESWNYPTETVSANTLFPLTLLKWCKENSPETKFIQASSSEIYGGAHYGPQSEETQLCPVTPYGFSKAQTHQIVQNYREKYGIFASNAILYNHESPLRKENFVTRKISKSVARIYLGLQEEIDIGNLEAERDWGWAPDYINGMILAASADNPGDFIFATGEKSSVGTLLKFAFQSVGIENYFPYLRIKNENQRKVDPQYLFGSNLKARQLLDWLPTNNIKDIMGKMVSYDLENEKRKIDYSDFSWMG
jgi:GDPmannose 4,6-dehydratase